MSLGSDRRGEAVKNPNRSSGSHGQAADRRYTVGTYVCWMHTALSGARFGELLGQAGGQPTLEPFNVTAAWSRWDQQLVAIQSHFVGSPPNRSKRCSSVGDRRRVPGRYVSSCAARCPTLTVSIHFSRGRHCRKKCSTWLNHRQPWKRRVSTCTAAIWWHC